MALADERFTVSLLPARATKTVYFVRHGEVRRRAISTRARRLGLNAPPRASDPFRRATQGFHNVAGAIDNNLYKDEKYFDAHLTPLGWQQARACEQCFAGRIFRVAAVCV